MNFKENESPRKLRGGYYTPADLASFLARWVLAAAPRDLLEPSSGDGAFVRALTALDAGALRRLTACELDPVEAAATEEATRHLHAVDCSTLRGDFLAWALEQLDGPTRFDAVLGNPPFVRYQYLDRELQERAEQLIRRFGLRFTRHTNAWVPFVVASLALLRPGGRLAMVVPSELLHVLHAASARRFLLDRCARVLVLDPDELWFDRTLQGTVLLLAERGPQEQAQPARVAIRRVSGRSFLDRTPDDLFADAAFVPGCRLPGKWMRALLSGPERALLEGLEAHPGVARFSELGKASVGIVTGANRFFLVPDRVVDRYDLHGFARPMFGRSEHVPGVIYDDDVHEANRQAGRATSFVHLDVPRDQLPPGALRYVERGEAEGLHTRYKCRIRQPWFTVPSVFTAPVAMLKRCHDLPRLVLNRADACTTDTAYRIAPRGTTATALVHCFVNSLTALSAELEGRHYGGGVLELVPSEIARLLLPRPVEPEPELVHLDGAVRRGVPPGEVLALQDPGLLDPLGLTRPDRDLLTGAWWTLRNRRQRRR